MNKEIVRQMMDFIDQLESFRPALEPEGEYRDRKYHIKIKGHACIPHEYQAKELHANLCKAIDSVIQAHIVRLKASIKEEMDK